MPPYYMMGEAGRLQLTLMLVSLLMCKHQRAQEPRSGCLGNGTELLFRRGLVSQWNNPFPAVSIM